MTHYDKLSNEEKIELLKTMYTSRFYETQIENLHEKGLIYGTFHLCIGQEANHASVSKAINKDDWIIGTHRGHGHYLGRGGNPKAMLAEVLGLDSGVCRGLSGSMHFTDIDNYNMGSSAVVGGNVPIAVGMAMALKYKNKDNIAVVFLGDGANNQGMAMESFNLAKVWQAPILFYCENNMYAISSPSEKYIAAEDIYKRAESFKIKSKKIDGNDVEEVYNAVKEAANYIRENKEPYFIEATTYRWCGHSRTDDCCYRDEKVDLKRKSDCPIKRYEEKLINNRIITPEQQKQLKNSILKQAQDDVSELITEMDNIIEYEEALTFVTPDFRGELWKK